MKKIIMFAIPALALALLSCHTAEAQGTVYVSSLGLTPTGSSAVGSDSWLAERFGTGTNAGGYLLDSIELALTDASGNPSGLTAMIYNKGPGNSGVFPGSSLGTLNGSLEPVSAGLYTYSPASSLTLSPSTIYFIVLTAGTPVAAGAYQWSATSTSSPTLSDGWIGGTALFSSSDGLNWQGIYPYAFPQFALSAIDVPEPSTLALLALGGCFLLVWRHRRPKAVGPS